MARKRFIDPSFWTDSAIGRLTYIERLFFIGCFSNADDEGRLPGNPAFLRSIIFAYDDLSVQQVREIRDKVVATCKNLILYTVNEDEYLAFRQWRRYQSPRYPQPSHIPAPSFDSKEPQFRSDTAASKNESQAQQYADEDADEAQEGFTSDSSLTQDCNCINASLTQDCVSDESQKTQPCRMGSGRDQVRDQVRDQDGIRSSAPPDATQEERLVLHELSKVPRYPLDMPRDLEHIRTIAVDFPTIDLLAEVKRWRAWLMDHPLKNKSNPRLRLRNWCEIAAKRNSERGDRDGRSSPTPGSPRRPGKYDDLVIT